MGASLREFSVRGRKISRRICEIPSLRQCRYAVCMIRAFEFDAGVSYQDEERSGGHGLRKRKGRRNDSTWTDIARYSTSVVPLLPRASLAISSFFFSPVIMRVAHIRMHLCGAFMNVRDEKINEENALWLKTLRICIRLLYALKRILKPMWNVSC